MWLTVKHEVDDISARIQIIAYSLHTSNKHGFADE